MMHHNMTDDVRICLLENIVFQFSKIYPEWCLDGYRYDTDYGGDVIATRVYVISMRIESLKH